MFGMTTSGCLNTHGLARLCQVREVTRSRSGWDERWGKVVCSDCTAIRVFITNMSAAGESGPELSRGGGSGELLLRGQQ